MDQRPQKWVRLWGEWVGGGGGRGWSGGGGGGAAAGGRGAEVERNFHHLWHSSQLECPLFSAGLWFGTLDFCQPTHLCCCIYIFITTFTKTSSAAMHLLLCSHFYLLFSWAPHLETSPKCFTMAATALFYFTHPSRTLPLRVWHSQPPGSSHKTLLCWFPHLFCFLHGMTFPFLSDRNPLWTHSNFKSNLKTFLFPKW